MSSLLPDFSHIYVERGAEHYPAAQALLHRFSEAQRIAIDDYKEIFNRPAQDWRLQKKSTKLILAVKKDNFLYEGSGFTPDFGFKHFYYNSLIQNCLYDCHYCYLQGMYPSANIVIFVNLADFFSATDEKLKAERPLYLCISYDTDLLAFETLVPYCRQWIQFAAARPELTLEIRSKSAQFKTLRDLAPVPNVIFAWTLSPESIRQKYETKTPSLQARLRAAKAALEAGWPVRICVDPMLKIPGAEIVYKEFFAQVFSALPPAALHDMSLGSFRMNVEYFKRIRRQRPDSDIIQFPYTRTGGTIGYSKEQKQGLFAGVREELARYLPENKIHLWVE